MKLRAPFCVACLSLLVAGPVLAQTPPRPDPPPATQFMSRYDFHLSAAALGVDDDRFTWDTHFGGDFDLVDYVRGRLSFLGDYQAVLGSEFRPFDPYEGNYTLDVASSLRAGHSELAVALHHVSRHLGDRPKLDAVAWNEVDGRLLRRLTVGRTTLDLIAEGGKVIAHAFVDYSWTGNVDVTARRPLNPNVGLFARGTGRIVGVLANSSRPTQHGGRLEGGLRLTGSDGALEFFAGAEQVIDADLFDGLTRRWAFVGFRIVSK